MEMFPVLWKMLRLSGKACSILFLSAHEAHLAALQPGVLLLYQTQCLHTLCQTSAATIYPAANTYNWSCVSKELLKGAKGRPAIA